VKETEKGFRDEFSFLSNFCDFETPMLYAGLVYRTNEHFYQAMKFTDSGIRKDISVHTKKGLKRFVKMHSRFIRDGWHSKKIAVMKYGLEYKFSTKNPSLRQKLIDTRNIELIEYNWWNDKFWGVSLKDGEGENNLGEILMAIRSEIQ